MEDEQGMIERKVEKNRKVTRSKEVLRQGGGLEGCKKL